MTPFEYARANDVADAIKQIATDPSAKFIAGGTNLIDLIKYDVEASRRPIAAASSSGRWCRTPISPTTR
jgi:xanthine dehydrogenase YagS FAD-binding subunit